MIVSKLTPLPDGQCIELTALSVNQACPVGFNTSLSLRFDVTTRTSLPSLTWRKAATNGDVLTPSSGTISGNGTSSVLTTDIVLDNSVVIEVVSGGDVYLTFSLRHY